ncbi:hypothetical protein [Mucilaginibacter endophyticus]|uniref:hypothetical protein n=1 Tax=Mucilaginibacter endophyticus TaxID=2675003 RepID=UPI001FC9CBD4|nr:hypothetical protein [Mucilaginibacter endophyticus]
MATPSEKLAAALAALQALQQRGLIAIHTDELSNQHRSLLTKQGFLKEVVRAWYIPARPNERAGDTTSWYANYWDFCARYLESRYGDQWIIMLITRCNGMWAIMQCRPS